MPARQSSLVDLVKIIRAGVLYFAIVFSVGFLLAIIRILLVVPRVGARIAELAEAPVMIAVSFFVARFLVRKLSIPFTLSARLGMGATGVVLMLIAEFGLVFWLRGASFGEYLSTRDPLTAGVYYFSLLVFASMPLVVGRGNRQREW